jgi:hypothetical protein
VPFLLDMFDNVVTFLLALDCHLTRGAVSVTLAQKDPSSTCAVTSERGRGSPRHTGPQACGDWDVEEAAVAGWLR